MSFTKYRAAMALLSIASTVAAFADMATIGHNGTDANGQPACLASCQINWLDNKGCNGEAILPWACANSFAPFDDTNDYSIPLCGSARIFGCDYNEHHLFFTVNSVNESSVQVMPREYEDCDWEPTCIGCEKQQSCTEEAIFMGTLTQDPGDTISQHSCSYLTAAWAKFQQANGGEALYRGC